MDVNGTRHCLLLGRRDWERCTDVDRRPLREQFAQAPFPCAEQGTGLGWDHRRNEVTLRECLDTFRARRGDRPPAIGSRTDPSERSDRRGAASDVFGNVYWIGDGRTEIRVRSSGTGQTSRFWPPETNQPTAPRYGQFGPSRPAPPVALQLLNGLAVTDDHYLVVGTIAPGGLLVFDLHAGGDPQHLCWPEDSFVPFDITARPNGGVWVLDRLHACVWALDRHFNVIPVGPTAANRTPVDAAEELFQPVGETVTRQRLVQPVPSTVLLEAAAESAAADPIAIETLGKNGLLVLDRNPGVGFSQLIAYWPDPSNSHSVSLEPFNLVGHDMAFVGAADERSIGRLFVVSHEGNQTFEFDVTAEAGRITLVLVPAYRPMRLFGGKGLITVPDGRVYYDVANGWVPLETQAQPRYAREGTLVTPPLDGRDPECVWHRVMLDAVIPPGADVVVATRAADDVRDLDAAAWHREPRLYLRGDGSELPFVSSPIREATDRGRGAGTWELLIQRSRGRYLQIRLTFQGDGRRSPRVRAMRVYYPRFSYVSHYLPAVYREDDDSASFLERFLANIEGFYTTIEGRVAAAQLLFDVQSAPPGALDWVASWLGVALDPAWDEQRRRLFIRHAMDFFQWRGTARGLLMAAELAVAERPDERIFTQPAGHGGRRPAASEANRIRIVERYRTRRTPARVLGDPTATVGPREVRATIRWHPAEGRATLNARYAAVLSLGASAEFPLARPPEPAGEKWRQFAFDTLGFVPAAPRTDPARWHGFLARRYQRIGALATAYGTTVDPRLPFRAVDPPVVLPNDGAPLVDWFEFERTLPPMHALAHRFTVMLPMRPGTPEAEQRTRLAHVRRVVELERPAHTVFDVKFYWALFRLGEARLGEDTLVERGGRAPELMRPATLGQTHLAESYVAPTPPFDAVDRQIVGRDRLDIPPLSGGEP